jgi:hypothetical protein
MRISQRIARHPRHSDDVIPRFVSVTVTPHIGFSVLNYASEIAPIRVVEIPVMCAGTRIRPMMSDHNSRHSVVGKLLLKPSNGLRMHAPRVAGFQTMT